MFPNFGWMRKDRFISLLLFTLFGFLAYRNCFGMLIPADSLSELYYFKSMGVRGILELWMKDSPFLFSIPLSWLIYQLAGVNPWAWITCSVLIHVGIAWLVYLFTAHLVKWTTERDENVPAFFAGLLFLISPYQTEAVIWTPTCLKLSLCVLFSIWSIYLAVRYLRFGNERYWVFAVVLGALAVFSYELAFVLPLLIFLLYLLGKVIPGNKVMRLNKIKRLSLLNLLFVLLFVSINKLINGHWLFHGGENLFTKVEWNGLSGTLLKYFIKFFTCFRYLVPDSAIEQMRAYYTPLWIFIALLVAFAMLTLLITQFSKNKNSLKLQVFLLLSFVLSLIPVLALDSSFLTQVYPDRYGYFAAVFVYPFIILIANAFTKKIFIPVLIVLCLMNVYWLELTTREWIESSRFNDQIIESFPKVSDQEEILVLNTPAYFNGRASFRSSLGQALFMHEKISHPEQIKTVAGTYLKNINDTLILAVRNAGTIEVIGPKSRTPYFSTGGGWARSYQSEKLAVEFNPDCNAYLLNFNYLDTYRLRVFYITGEYWKELVERNNNPVEKQLSH